MPNNISARALYERSKDVLFNAWVDDPRFRNNPAACRAYVDSMRLTQSFLRFELATATTLQTYNFAVTAQQKGGGTVFPTEQFLNMQDSFVVNEVGFFIGLFSGATSGIAKLKTFMNTGDANFAAMNAWWTTGVFSLRVNNEVVVPAFDLWRNFYVPQTQATALVAAATGPQNDVQDQIRGAEDGMYPVEPNWVLIGSKNNQPSVTLAAPMTAVTANSRVVMIVRGVLAQNSTPVS